MKKYQYYHLCGMIWGIWGCVLNDPLKSIQQAIDLWQFLDCMSDPGVVIHRLHSNTNLL